VLKKMAREPGIQMGFSDAGAHLRNMAFYNFGLRLLRHVYDGQKAGKPFMTIEQAVHRLTGELADWYHLDAGHLRIGDRADLVIVDPAHLDDSLDSYTEEKVEQYGGMSRMVNRNDDTVSAVLVAGRAVFLNGQPTQVLGSQRTGSFLRADTSTPAARRAATEPVSAAI
jgi:N-acyl-D-aspartate/D-glutamate deacylase